MKKLTCLLQLFLGCATLTFAQPAYECHQDGKVTFTYIDMKDEEKVNAEVGDYEGIVNEGRDLEGVEVSIFLHQIDKGYKASLRSNSYVNVSEICGKFGDCCNTIFWYWF